MRQIGWRTVNSPAAPGDLLPTAAGLTADLVEAMLSMFMTSRAGRVLMTGPVATSFRGVVEV